MILKHENTTHELLDSLPADWPEAQPYLQNAIPLFVGAASMADLETFYQEGRFKLYLVRRKSDSEIVASTLMQVSNNQHGLVGIFHFLFAADDFDDYAVEFVFKVEELMQAELGVFQFIGMARKPFTQIFNGLGVYAPPRLIIDQVHDWDVSAPWES